MVAIKNINKLKNNVNDVMKDICYACSKVQNYGTMHEINQVDFDIFCDKCFEELNHANL